MPLACLREIEFSRQLKSQGRVAVATSVRALDIDQDLSLVVEALNSLGMQASAEVWDDEGVDWTEFDLVVVRSTWDYTHRRDRYLAWARSIPKLANPADVISWNTDKRYLADLRKKGVATVSTQWLEPGDRIELTSGEIVVKPAVGAGALGAGRYGPEDRTAAARHVSKLHDEGHTVMVQPYLDALELQGEHGLVFLGDTYSHCIYKPPLLANRGEFIAGTLTTEMIEPVEPTDVERQFAEKVLDAVPRGRDRLLYARVDLVTRQDDKPVLMELEVTEPHLYLLYCPGSAERFAKSVEALLTES